MTAPAAPTIDVNGSGWALYVRWRSVSTAATYKVYAGSTANPTTLVATVSDDASGWNQAVIPAPSRSYVRVTSVNAGAEESGYSNEVRFDTPDAGRRLNGPYRSPFG